MLVSDSGNLIFQKCDRYAPPRCECYAPFGVTAMPPSVSAMPPWCDRYAPSV